MLSWMIKYCCKDQRRGLKHIVELKFVQRILGWRKANSQLLLILRESLVSGGDGDDATQMRPRSIVLSIRMKYLGRDETCSHVGLPKSFMAVGYKGIFCEKDGEQDCARKGVDYLVVRYFGMEGSTKKGV